MAQEIIVVSLEPSSAQADSLSEAMELGEGSVGDKMNVVRQDGHVDKRPVIYSLSAAFMPSSPTRLYHSARPYG